MTKTKPNPTTILLAKFDLALTLWRGMDSKKMRDVAWANVQSAHAALLKALRDDTPDPDWASYPIARDFFTQTASV